MSISHRNGIALTGLSAINGISSISAINGIGASLGSSVITPELLWWKMNDGSGTTITAEVGPNGSTNAAWVTGKSGSGSALDYNGSTHHSESGSSLNFGGATTATICFWAYLDDLSPTQILFETGPNAGTVDGSVLVYLDSSNINFALQESVSPARANGGNFASPSTGAWNHIAFKINTNTAGSTTIAGYINGTLQTTSSPANNTTGSGGFATQIINVGARDGGASLPFNGRIDDVRVFNRILDSTELAAVIADAQ